MEMQSVISSNISAVGFDKVSNTIRVRFTSGEMYEAAATQLDFDTFLAAKSKGVHFNKVLKKAFAWSKVEKKG